MDDGGRAHLSAGTRVAYDGQVWDVAELAPPSVLLAGPAGVLRRVSISHLLAAPGTRVGDACGAERVPGAGLRLAGGGAPILIDGHRVDGPIPGNEESTSLQPLHLQVPPGKLWVTGVRWNLAAPDVYHLGEPGGGLIDKTWVVAFESRADIGHMCPNYAPRRLLDGAAVTPC